MCEIMNDNLQKPRFVIVRLVCGEVVLIMARDYTEATKRYERFREDTLFKTNLLYEPLGIISRHCWNTMSKTCIVCKKPTIFYLWTSNNRIDRVKLYDMLCKENKRYNIDDEVICLQCCGIHKLKRIYGEDF